MAEVGLMLPGWGAHERMRVTRKRIRALNTQLQTLMRETFNFAAKPKPKPREGMEDVAGELRDLFAQWVPWFQQALEQPAEAYDGDAIPNRLDAFADDYDAVRRRVARRLKLQGKHTRTVRSEMFQQQTDPSVLDQLIRAPGAALTGVGIGAIALLVFLAMRRE